MRASSVAAGTAAAAFVLDIHRSVASSADVQHTQHLKQLASIPKPISRSSN